MCRFAKSRVFTWPRQLFNRVANFHRRLDPRVKMICVFSLAAAVAVTPVHYYQKFLAYTVIIALLGVVSRVSLKQYFTRFLFLVPLLLFLGAALFIFPAKQGNEKIMVLYNLSIKTLLTFCSFGILAAAVRFDRLIKGLEAMKVPPMVTAMLGFAYRYVYLFRAEAGRFMKARKSRGFGKPSKGRQFKLAAGVIPYFMFRLLERSRNIYIAMLSRGYNDSRPYPGVNTLRLTARDYGFGIAFHLLLLAAAVL